MMPQTILSAAASDGQLNLLKSGAFSDFRVICHNHEYKVHRAIVCPTSRYFSKVCANGFAFMVSLYGTGIAQCWFDTEQEGIEAAVHLNEDDPAIISRVLLYQYTKAYDAGEVPQIGATKAAHDLTRAINKADVSREGAPSQSKHTNEQTLYKTDAGLRLTIDQGKHYLSVHAEVYACADRLGIDELTEYACNRFVDIAKDDGMALYLLSFYGDILAYIYENTIIERAQVSAHAERGAMGNADGLKHAATMCTLKNLTQAPVASEIEKAVKEHEPMAWEVAQVLRARRTKFKEKDKQTQTIVRYLIKRRHSVQQSLKIAKRRLAHKGLEEVIMPKRSWNSCKTAWVVPQSVQAARKC